MRGFRQAKGRLFAPVVACTLLALAAAIPAGAYFTTSGSGTGRWRSSPASPSSKPPRSAVRSRRRSQALSAISWRQTQVASPSRSPRPTPASPSAPRAWSRRRACSPSAPTRSRGRYSDTFGGTRVLGYTLKVTTTPMFRPPRLGTRLRRLESGSFSDQRTSGAAVRSTHREHQPFVSSAAWLHAARCHAAHTGIVPTAILLATLAPDQPTVVGRHPDRPLGKSVPTTASSASAMTWRRTAAA